MDYTFYTTGLVVGLLGSTHCIGMCGGIVGALNSGLPAARNAFKDQIAHHLTYNTGRMLSYVLAGVLAGLAGSLISKATLGSAVPVGRLIAGLLMIALGLYLAGWWQALSLTEKAGFHVWRWIKPLGGRFLPANTPPRAFGLGIVWGWLPCGLVYSVLALALASASPVTGAITMLGFGIGTLPMLLAMGGIAKQLIDLMRRPVLRQITGLCIVLFGVYNCVTAFGMHGHHPASAALTVPDAKTYAVLTADENALKILLRDGSTTQLTSKA